MVTVKDREMKLYIYTIHFLICVTLTAAILTTHLHATLRLLMTTTMKT